MKKIFTIILILISFTSYGKLMNKLGSVSKPIWDSIPEPTCENDHFYDGVTIMLVVGSGTYNGQSKYWDSYNKVYLYYLDDFKKMSKRGANLYFFMSPEVSKSTILETLPIADMIVYIGHGGFRNNIPSIFNMDITIEQFKKENPTAFNVHSSSGYFFYSITPSDLSNIKLKSNSIVFMFTVCNSSGSSASDPRNGISLDEAKKRTESYSNMFLSRGAKCYFAYNTLKTMFPLFESGLSIKDVRSRIIKESQYNLLKGFITKDIYFSKNHLIFNTVGKTTICSGNKCSDFINQGFGYCLVGDFNYNINTLRGKY